jgi:predicted Zn-dependent protease
MAGVIVLAIGLAAVLIWVGFLFFGYRKLYGSDAGREDDLRFELNAAPWSDNHVETLLARNPGSPVLLGQYVANAVERKDWPEALRRADLFVARVPRSPHAWLARIDALSRAGREEDADAVLRKAVRRMPREPNILLAWARDAGRHEDWAEASRRYVLMRRRDPRRVEGYNEGANVLIRDGRPDKAESVIAEGLRAVPENWMMWSTAARIADSLENHNEAIRRWEAMRARFPAEPAGFLGGAEALARAGRGEEAAALIRDGRDFFPGDKPISEAAARLAPPAP